MTMSTRGRPSCARGMTCDVDHLAAVVPDRLGAEQVEDLRLEHALVAHRLVAPDDERHLLGIAAVLLDVIGQHLLAPSCTPSVPRRRLRHLVRIDAVEVLAGRVRVRVADRLAAAAGPAGSRRRSARTRLSSSRAARTRRSAASISAARTLALFGSRLRSALTMASTVLSRSGLAPACGRTCAGRRGCSGP